MNENIYDIIIIGGGCAGLTAAVYTRRAGKTVLLLENNSFGGQITLTSEVENFPGFMNISGAELSERLHEQASALGTETVFDTATGIKENGRYKTVSAEYGEYTGRAVIIAGGLRQRKTGLDEEDKFIGRGVSYCAVCDGAFYKNKRVAVLGGGNTALGDAAFLADICESVTVIHRRDEFRADKSAVLRLKEKSNVNYELNCVLTAINGENAVSSVTVENTLTGEEKEIPVSGLFVAIGQLPQNEAYKAIVELDGYGYIKAGEDCRTSCSGIFAAGDCRTKELRQLVTAAADGAVAAANACKYADETVENR
ncbi:MAG: thioredoxin-disulfide reductase [Acutalibacteraceae bacterium]